MTTRITIIVGPMGQNIHFAIIKIFLVTIWKKLAVEVSLVICYRYMIYRISVIPYIRCRFWWRLLTDDIVTDNKRSRWKFCHLYLILFLFRFTSLWFWSESTGINTKTNDKRRLVCSTCTKANANTSSSSTNDKTLSDTAGEFSFPYHARSRYDILRIQMFKHKRTKQ